MGSKEKGKPFDRRGWLVRALERKEADAMAYNSERRKNLRLNIRWPVTVETPAADIEGETVNISPSGAYIQCPLTPAAGEMVTLAISPNDHPPMKIKAEVIWVAAAPPIGMGVAFLELSKADSHYLKELIKSKLA